MKNTFKRIVTIALALAMTAVVVLSCVSCDKTPKYEKIEGDFTYLDSVSTLAANWNPHTYQTTDDSYPASFIRAGFYDFIFNDASHSIEGKEDFSGYKIIPSMAASDPVDVTEKVKAEHPEFGIPESATKGFAYTIDLNKKAVWENGEAINADSYVYSMKRLLDPELLNYRATDYISGAFVIANGDKYYYQGTTNYADNGVNAGYTLADCTKNGDYYYTPDGDQLFFGVDFPLDWCSGNSLKDYVDAYGDAYFKMDTWEELVALVDENGLVPVTDATYALFAPVTTGNDNWGETEDDLFNYYVVATAYEDNYDFANVGLYKSGDYQITIVFAKSLSGFNLFYNLTSNWLVNETLYEANLSKVGDTDAWTSTYNTSVETTLSYGPYKLVAFQADKSMRFEKNETWYGYDDPNYIYVDPTDGKTYQMYQTTAIDCQVVAEAATRKLMFLKGQLMGYGLQSDDYDAYRGSEYCYATPSETIFFFIFNGYVDAINNREANEGFDTTKFDLQTMTLTSFRKAIAVTYDKEALCTEVSPSRSGGYGLIGNNYIYDPDTGAKYRDTEQAKKALCEFYSVDVSKFDSLDDAVDSITGYDPVAAKALFTQAYNEAIEKNYITDADGDGKSDQTIEITYASSSHSDFIEKTLNYLNKKLAEVLVGTPFEGKIRFVESAPMGSDWSNQLKAGMADTCLAGWSGSALDPFGLSDLYVNPNYQYDAKWFDASSVSATLNIEGKDITLTLKQWSDALNGTTVTANGTEYNFGEASATVDTRLAILAKIEATVLQTYDYIPMLQDGSMALLSQQVYYVVEEYNPIMGRGGIAYMKYNYNDAAWAEYVASQPDGQLSY